MVRLIVISNAGRTARDVRSTQNTNATHTVYKVKNY